MSHSNLKVFSKIPETEELKESSNLECTENETVTYNNISPDRNHEYNDSIQSTNGQYVNYGLSRFCQICLHLYL